MQQRRSIVSTTAYSNNSLSFNNPWIVMWWSAAFPGFGHFRVNSYAWGFFLMSFEYVVNTFSNINTSIFYSMIGEFDKAKEIINLRYFFVYITVYVFAMWDAYRRAVESNKSYQLAYNQTGEMKPFHFTALELNILEKKKPLLSLVWSLLMPALGYIYLQRLAAALFSFFWWGFVLHFSHLLEGVYFSSIGDFAKATSVIDPQWILYFPSIYLFSMYDTYAKAVVNNKVFEIEQGNYLRNHFQQGNFDEIYESMR
ncbi:hypothetical protein [Paenibacillus thermotolerans]|uniref:hypothetical protein n=1 Tax=Paenibacillus thermotolerans TaxID=3027807 RepID=UPI002368E5C4|nr:MULTISPECIES: hypothetical protein [unclassified Paenibacillus]